MQSPSLPRLCSVLQFRTLSNPCADCATAADSLGSPSSASSSSPPSRAPPNCNPVHNMHLASASNSTPVQFPNSNFETPSSAALLKPYPPSCTPNAPHTMPIANSSTWSFHHLCSHNLNNLRNLMEMDRHSLSKPLSVTKKTRNSLHHMIRKGHGDIHMHVWMVIRIEKS
jgi:hypothetical protein